MRKGVRSQFAVSSFVWVVIAGLLLTGALAASEPEGSRLLGRLVQVHDIWCQHGTQWSGSTGVTVNAVVRANGLLGETMRGAVRLRDRDGRPVQATFGALAQFMGANGIFQAASTDPIRFDSAEWKPFHIFVPYNLLALPAGQQHRLIVTFEASCRGLSSIAEADIALPPDERGESGAPRELRIVSFVESPHLLLLPRPPAFSPPNVAGMGPEGPGTTPGAHLCGLVRTDADGPGQGGRASGTNRVR